MQLKEGFILRTVAGETVVVPTGAQLQTNMMITLNETGKFLWERLEKGADEEALVAALLGEYDVDEERARISVQAFVKKLSENGFLC